MRILPTAISLAVLGAVIACDRSAAPPPKPEPEPWVGPPPPTCASDADCAAPAFCDYRDNRCNTIAVALELPYDDVYLQCDRESEVTVRASYLTGRVFPAWVELRLDEQSLGSIRFGITYALRFPAGFPEGGYELSLHAGVGTHEVVSARRIFVDRTPPRLAAIRPDPALPEFPPGVAELEFSEPIAEAQLRARDDLVPYGYSVGSVSRVDPRIVLGPWPGGTLWSEVTGTVRDRAGNVSDVSVRWEQPPLVVTVDADTQGLPRADGQVPMAVHVTGGTVDALELRHFRPDGSGDAVELEPPYAWTWDASAEREGTHVFEATATRNGREFRNNGLRLLIDRHPPTVSLDPAAGPITSTELLWLRFSEPVSPWPPPPEAFRITDEAGRALPFDLPAPEALRRTRPSAGPSTITVEVIGPFTDAAGWPLTPFRQTLEQPEWFPAQFTPATEGGPFRPRDLRASRTDDAGALLETYPAGRPGPVYDSSFWTRLDFVPPGAFDVTSVYNASAGRTYAWTEPTLDGSTRVHVGPGQRAAAAAYPSTAHRSGEPALALHPTWPANPFVAWTEGDSGTSQVRVARWDGAAWIPLPDPTAGAVAATSPALVVGLDGALVMAWLDAASGVPQVRMRRWTAAAGWGELWTGPGADPAQPATAPRLAVGSDGLVALVWTEPFAGREEIRGATFDGAGWAPLAPLASAAGEARSPSVVVGATGAIAIAYVDDDGGARLVRVVERDGDGWREAGTPVNDATGDGAFPIVALTGDRAAPCVAWSESGDLVVACRNR